MVFGCQNHGWNLKRTESKAYDFKFCYDYIYSSRSVLIDINIVFMTLFIFKKFSIIPEFK